MQLPIVTALRKVGIQVLSLAPLGSGVPDLLVFTGDKLLLLEVKTGTRVPSARHLTPDQESFHARWPVHIVESVEDALAICGIRARMKRTP